MCDAAAGLNLLMHVAMVVVEVSVWVLLMMKIVQSLVRLWKSHVNC